MMNSNLDLTSNDQDMSDDHLMTDDFKFPLHKLPLKLTLDHLIGAVPEKYHLKTLVIVRNFHQSFQPI